MITGERLRSRFSSCCRISKPFGAGMSKSSSNRSQGLACNQAKPSTESLKVLISRRPKALRLDSSRRRLARTSSITTTVAKRNTSDSIVSDLVEQRTHQPAQLIQIDRFGQQP